MHMFTEGMASNQNDLNPISIHNRHLSLSYLDTTIFIQVKWYTSM